MTWLRRLWRKLFRRKPKLGTGTLYVAPLGTPAPSKTLRLTNAWDEVGHTTLDAWPEPDVMPAQIEPYYWMTYQMTELDDLPETELG